MRERHRAECGARDGERQHRGLSQPGSVAIVWALLGSASVARSRAVVVTGSTLAVAPAVCGIALFFLAVQPQQDVDRRLEEAARPLRAGRW